jgi:hypothetical protein
MPARRLHRHRQHFPWRPYLPKPSSLTRLQPHQAPRQMRVPPVRSSVMLLFALPAHSIRRLLTTISAVSHSLRDIGMLPTSMCVSVICSIMDHGAIGSHYGSSRIYCALSVIDSGCAEPLISPTFANAQPFIDIPLHPAWSARSNSKIVSLGPSGHLVPGVVAKESADGLDVPARIAVTKARWKVRELEDAAMRRGRGFDGVVVKGRSAKDVAGREAMPMGVKLSTRTAALEPRGISLN